MFNIRTTMLALAAVATLGTALVTSTDSADARPGFHGGGRGGAIGRVHVGPRVHIGGRVHVGPRIHVRPGLIRPIRIGHIRPILRPHWCGRFAWRCRPIVRWPRPVIVGAPVVAAATYAVAPRVTSRCTCLTKEYTQDGLVVFQDVCTKEIAAAPIGNTQLPPAGATSTYPAPAPQTQLAPEAQPQTR